MKDKYEYLVIAVLCGLIAWGVFGLLNLMR